MTSHSWQKRLLAGLAALLLLLLFALPAFAASERVEAVQVRLATLKGSDINPDWLPDIRANEANVQQLLTLYTACTDEEKKEFTSEELTDLRAYFVALYQVQGKDVAGVDALFTTSGAGASSGGSASSTSATSEEEAPSSAAISSSEASPPPSSSRSSVASISASASMPAVSAPPAGTSSNGWLGFFGNGTLGAAILIVLLVLAGLIFLRFLASLRAAGRLPRSNTEADEQAQQLFGENYQPPSADKAATHPSSEGEVPQIQAEAKASFKQRLRGKAWKAEALTDEAEETARPQSKNAMAAGFVEEASAPKVAFPAPAAKGTALPVGEKAATPIAGGAAALPVDEKLPAATKAAATSGASAAKDKAVVSSAAVTGAAATQAAGTGPAGIGHNPDTPNSITLHSFSAPQRTGKPPKMTFRQGSPDDLDAIDD